jgi:hypothetical protein
MTDFRDHARITVISGGQTGVDIAALRAAQCLGYRTGGAAPKNFKTQIGMKRELGPNFGLYEHTGGYAARTRANVMQADLTLILAANMESAGTKLTIDTCNHYHKPWHAEKINWVQNGFTPMISPQACEQIVELIIEMINENPDKGFVLNVAGNSSTTAPGIFVPAFASMVNILSMLYDKGSAQMQSAIDPAVMGVAQQLSYQSMLALSDNYSFYEDLHPKSKRLLVIDSEDC